MRKKLASGKYGELPNYLNALMVTARDFGHKYKYTSHSKAIWKGVNPNADFDPNSYKIGNFG